MPAINIGTAGWSIPKAEAHHFPAGGTSLERYASRFSVTEINSSFHRPHRLDTWERWRDSVPDSFRFAVKVPKTITHQAKLLDCSDLLVDFMRQVFALGEKLAVLLVQLPPTLEFDVEVAGSFFADLRARTSANIACEPRNASWFTHEADALFIACGVARVAADPAICDAAAKPGGWTGLSYWRLHGSPVIYRSSYADRIDGYAKLLRRERDEPETWFIFDNTASSAATSDALSLMEAIQADIP